MRLSIFSLLFFCCFALSAQTESNTNKSPVRLENQAVAPVIGTELYIQDCDNQTIVERRRLMDIPFYIELESVLNTYKELAKNYGREDEFYNEIEKFRKTKSL